MQNRICNTHNRSVRENRSIKRENIWEVYLQKVTRTRSYAWRYYPMYGERRIFLSWDAVVFAPLLSSQTCERKYTNLHAIIITIIIIIWILKLLATRYGILDQWYQKHENAYPKFLQSTKIETYKSWNKKKYISKRKDTCNRLSKSLKYSEHSLL